MENMSHHTSPLEEPKPKALFAGTDAVAWFKPAALTHRDCILIGKRHAEPGAVRVVRHSQITLQFELEQLPRLHQARDFPHVGFDDLAAPDVVEHARRKSKVENRHPPHAQSPPPD